MTSGPQPVRDPIRPPLGVITRVTTIPKKGPLALAWLSFLGDVHWFGDDRGPNWKGHCTPWPQFIAEFISSERP